MVNLDDLGFASHESEVLLMLLRGYSQKEISVELRVDLVDVETCVRSLYRKFQVKTRAQFMATWIPKYVSDRSNGSPADRGLRASRRGRIAKPRQRR